MLNQESETFLNPLKDTLALPIRSRCAQLAVLLDRASPFDLHTFFPILIDHIFGPQGQMCWGLRTTLRTSKIFDDDFTQLHHFLNPNGAFFKLIYKLMQDPSAKYEFPVAFLPRKVQQMLESRQFHPFYTELVHTSRINQMVSLLLNPFDYYIFHFAHHLINPWHQRGVLLTSSTTNDVPWNTVYFTLCCDYMIHFLPTERDSIIQPPILYDVKHRPPPKPFVPSRRETTLINSSFIRAPVEEDQNYSYRQSYGEDPRHVYWRSETVLNAFIDMWFTNDQVTLPVPEINSALNNSQTILGSYNELPSTEYMRIVRVFIKKIHPFVQSAQNDRGPLCELKKNTMPMLQGKFYIFLRNLIHRWPLDESFRLILELWLSYLQPWRYPPSHTNANLNENDNGEEVDEANQQVTYRPAPEHIPFIADNLLAYVVTFQQVLPRFAPVDLVSPKLAIMLYRITKVWNQPNLITYLKEIEYSVMNNSSPIHVYNMPGNSNLPLLQPTSNWCTNKAGSQMFNISHSITQNETILNNQSLTDFTVKSPFLYISDRKWAAVVRQKIYELEGSNFCYKPLFTKPPANEVFDVIKQIRRSLMMAKEIVKERQVEEQRLRAGFWGMIKSLWHPDDLSGDNFTLTERLKVPLYLEISLQNLLEIFSITELPPSIFDPDLSDVPVPFPSGHVITPKRLRERNERIRYEGDPDLTPIRTTELTVMVRVLYQLAQVINDAFGEGFTRLYYSPGYTGRLARQFLLPPMTVYKMDRTRLGTPRVAADLPPRVSFRVFGSMYFAAYFAFGSIFGYFSGYGILNFWLFIAIIVIIYKAIKAIPRTHWHSYPTEGFGNISFSDSF